MPRDLAQLLGWAHHEWQRPAAATLGELLRAAERDATPGLLARLTESDGTIRQHINIFVGDRNARTDGGLDLALADGDEVWVIRAVSGG